MTFRRASTTESLSFFSRQALQHANSLQEMAAKREHAETGEKLANRIASVAGIPLEHAAKLVRSSDSTTFAVTKTHPLRFGDDDDWLERTDEDGNLLHPRPTR